MKIQYLTGDGLREAADEFNTHEMARYMCHVLEWGIGGRKKPDGVEMREEFERILTEMGISLDGSLLPICSYLTIAEMREVRFMFLDFLSHVIDDEALDD